MQLSSQLSWNEIRDRALQFSKSWSEESSEDAEAKSFWDDFFNIFGIRRRLVASFEEKVRNARGKYSYIDLFWSGKLLVEHKSLGKDLDKAKSQAFEYIEDLIRDGRSNEVPRYVLLSDFQKFVLYDLEPEDRELPRFKQFNVATTSFALRDLAKHVKEFAFIRGEKAVRLDPEDPANIEAAEIMGDLHDALSKGGFGGHDLERFLVRVLFCMFAEDTGIFEPAAFTNFVEYSTAADGSDLGIKLARLFEVLNTEEHRRQKNLDEELSAFPYVNGDLFAERLAFADFTSDMREALLECCRFRWDKISPAVFGSMFQGVIEPRARRQIGAHYTSERDILKLIGGLFLDDLRAELAASKTASSLEKLHKKISNLKFLDPACGCGNFLVVTYRELRILELELLKRLHKPADSQFLDVKGLVRLSVENLYGIEIEEWPARIAEVALWLMDHQMNQLVAETYGRSVPSIPLRKSPHIHQKNALRHDWTTILPPRECSFVLGNPPFIGKKARNADQKHDMDLVWGDVKNASTLDYVTCWYKVAASYTRDTTCEVAFVSTNSIIQGEQTGILWDHLLQTELIFINFAHRTFRWESEARGKAHVHVVIIGFSHRDKTSKRLFDYLDDKPVESRLTRISPYLTDSSNTTLKNISKPIFDVPSANFGSMPNDDGNLLFTTTEKAQFIRNDPVSAKFFRAFLSAHEYLHGEERWCLWLEGVEPSELKKCPLVLERIERIRTYRNASTRDATRRLANYPSLFGEIRVPRSQFILIPRHSSENRAYIPLSFFDPGPIPNDSCLFIEAATLYHFGVISSKMHMAWVSAVCGRIKSDYRYSAQLVYNNFPWPENPRQKLSDDIEEAARAMLRERQKFQRSTLADLYDQETMPPGLAKAHEALDRAVDRLYRDRPFSSTRERVELLFSRYEAAIQPLLETARPRRRRL